jgi:hypothetical protein
MPSSESECASSVNGGVVLNNILRRLEQEGPCALCEGDKRILSFSNGIGTVECWLCNGTGERGPLACRVGFLMRVLVQRSGGKISFGYE